ncbi:sodium:proton antiporter [Alkalihalobacterium sp. APHAB7]|uniref:sodium:proton antiporter n=1 Tax=Alkalihalobacterium sp. APHAB7 TaxID=3402081 RepID=UPI003AAA8838
MISRLFMLIIVYFVYRFRYRILNALLGQRWIRKSAVKWTMKIPGLRQKFMSEMMFGSRSGTVNNQ